MSELSISFRRDSLALTGSLVDTHAAKWLGYVPEMARKQREERDKSGSSSFHVTIMTSAEVGVLRNAYKGEEFTLVKKMIQEDFIKNFKTEKFAFMAMGLSHCVSSSGGLRNKEGWYLPLYCPFASQLRDTFNLPPKNIHITLGFLNGDPYGGNATDFNGLIGSIKYYPSIQDMCSLCLSISTSNQLNDTIRAKELRFQVLNTFLYKLIEQYESFSEEHHELMDRCLREAAKYAIAMKWYALSQDIGSHLCLRNKAFGLKCCLVASMLQQEQQQTNVLQHSVFPLLANRSSELKLKYVQKPNPSLWNLVREGNIILMKDNAAWTFKESVVSFEFHKKDQAYLEKKELPRSFSWIDLSSYDLQVNDNVMGTRNNNNNKSNSSFVCNTLPKFLLCGSAIPTHEGQLSALKGVGISHIIKIHEDAVPAALTRTAVEYGVQWHHFNVDDRTPPSMQQTNEMYTIMDKAICAHEGVLVHCQGGVGRTNTMIVAYLMKKFGLSMSDALHQVTAQRPKVILSHTQVEFLKDKWWKACNNERTEQLMSELVTVEESSGNESGDDDLEKESAVKAVKSSHNSQLSSYNKLAKTLSMPELIICCGFAASGKTTFSKSLTTAHPDFFSRVNKDEMRAKSQCEDVLFDAIKANKKRGYGCVVIDCCNLTKEKRREWVNLAHSQKTWCVYFDIPIEQCKSRIQRRNGHPTIPPGPGGLRILDSMAKKMEPPSDSEKFQKLIVIESEREVHELLKSWSIPIDDSNFHNVEDTGKENFLDNDDALLKFPRTSHILNLGAATRDDKVLGTSDLARIVGSVSSDEDRSPNLVIEEKMDGANMGIFISKSTYKIIAQNRSHFVSSKYHPQFSPLDRWMDNHSQDLWQILEPGRHILYGEWLYAVHSVEYTTLPGWFIAYDLFDKKTQSFVSRQVLAEKLAQTSIPHVPVVHHGPINNIEQIKAMVDGPSAFNEAKREGIVVRVQDSKNERLVMRAKLVRSDFIAGNERWNKSSKLQTNKLKIEGEI